MPVATRTPTYENLGRWAVEVFAVHLLHPNPSLWIPAFAGIAYGLVKGLIRLT